MATFTGPVTVLGVSYVGAVTAAQRVPAGVAKPDSYPAHARTLLADTFAWPNQRIYAPNAGITYPAFISSDQTPNRVLSPLARTVIGVPRPDSYPLHARMALGEGLITARTRGVGSYSITGDVTFSGSLAQRRVRIFEELGGLMLDDVWSDPVTGIFTFTGLSNVVGHTIVAYDLTNTFASQVWTGVMAS